MSDQEFRNLLKAMFPQMPGYHIQAVVKLAKKKERPEPALDRMSKVVGGIL